MQLRVLLLAFLGLVPASCSTPESALPLPAPARSFTAGFEGTAPGPLLELRTGVGRFTSEEGHARIDGEHAHGGAQCLHLGGGEERRFELELEPAAGAVAALSFQAERWTAREPFAFRVEAFGNGAWRSRWVGDGEVEVGSFRSHVRVPLEPGDHRLRFTCTSPAGVLLDDFALARRAPMELEDLAFSQPTTPSYAGRADNPVAVLNVRVGGTEGKLALTSLAIDLGGTTDLADVEAIELVAPDGTRLGPLAPERGRLELRGELALQEGDNRLVLAFTLAPGANLDHRLDVRCHGVGLSNGATYLPRDPDPVGAQRIGLALRDAGDDGAEVYRIPGLVTTRSGTLLAVYDVRWKGWADLPGDIDVGLSRSVDGGRTFEPMRVILDMGADPAFAFDGVGDPSVLVDEVTGTIWVAALWSHGDRGWHGSGPGLSPQETGQLLLIRSDDDGLTWSAPRNLTREVKDPSWRLLLQGPGRGITLADGTLVFPAQYRAGDTGLPWATILYSQDHGETWRLGAGVKSDTTEAQVAELENGSLMLNARDNRGGSRAVYVTRDLGTTWTEHESSRSALVEPVCNAALLRAGDVLVFCNPDVPAPPRRRMTLKASRDDGRTWPLDQRLLLDEGQSAGYPSLTLIDGETLGVLYEGSGAQLVFQRVSLADFVGDRRR